MSYKSRLFVVRQIALIVIIEDKPFDKLYTLRIAVIPELARLTSEDIEHQLHVLSTNLRPSPSNLVQNRLLELIVYISRINHSALVDYKRKVHQYPLIKLLEPPIKR